jgi:hypothetical protein
MPDETLLTMANEIRGKTLRLLDGVSDDAARFTAGLSNPVLWHAGHALMLVEHLCIVPAAGGSPQYPKGWFEVFGWQSRPALVPRDAWPPLAEVVDRLRDQLNRLRVVIANVTPDQLDRITDPSRNRTLRSSIVHGLHDEASHQGEIHLLKKLFGKQMAAATGGGS